METGLYVHIPFCVRKCIYCDFYSEETLTGPIGQRLRTPLPDRTEFMDALEQEFRGLPTGFRPQTVFIGGGTPTELSDGDLQRLFDLIARYVDCGAVEEWTCEVNPGTLTERKAHLLRAGGVNRISMGVQSFHPQHLEFLGRIHGPADVLRHYALLRAAGFENINLDLIYGVPGSTIEQTRQDIEQLLALKPEHASCYCLTFEENTPLMTMKRQGFVSEMDAELEHEQYQLIRGALKATGYVQYELSNFARGDRPCRHNLLYWSGGEYIGCGPSAHSHWQGRRYANVRHLRRYCRALQDRASPVDFEETLPPERKARETLVMSLRRLEGISRAAFRERTGHDYQQLCGEQIAHFCALGLLEESGDRLRLTEAGLFVSDGIFAELV